MARPPKLPTETPKWLQGARTEVQDLAAERLNLNVMVTNYDYHMLQEAAALRSAEEGNNVTVSDIVRGIITKGLQEISRQYNGQLEQLALGSIEYQVALVALRQNLQNK